MQKRNIYFHINNEDGYGITPIDIGYGHTKRWRIKNNYPYFSFHYLIDGKAWVKHDDIEEEVNKGQAFIIYPNKEVEYYCETGENIEFYWINFNGINCRNIFDNIDDKWVLSISNKKRIINLFENCFENLKNDSSSIISPYACIYGILETIAQEHPTKDTIKKEDLNTDFQKILNIINIEMFKPDFSETDVAKKCGLSTEHFSRLFVKKMGINFVTYVSLEKVKKASSLLEKTDMSIKAIAYSVGFSNVYYFCKVFKKYRVYTPTKYREKSRSNIKE